jgi:hypothetical protein
MTPYPDLMLFWAVCISWSALFLTAVSMYLYVDSRKSREKNSQTKARQFRSVRDFVFVWVLLGLLGLYIASIDVGSSMIFAAGNVVVEAILILYTLKSKTSKETETTAVTPVSLD